MNTPPLHPTNRDLNQMEGPQQPRENPGMIATCTKCGNQFDGNDGPEHTNHVTAFEHLPEQHYSVVADLSGAGNEPVRIEIPEPVAELIRTGQLTLAIVPDPEQPRGLGFREITLTQPASEPYRAPLGYGVCIECGSGPSGFHSADCSHSRQESHTP